MTIRAVTLGWVGLVAAVACACSSPPSTHPISVSTQPATHVASSTAVSAPTSVPTSAASPVTPASASQLTGIVLKSSDLPAGWTGAPFQGNPHIDAINAAFDKCLGIRDPRPDQVADVHSQSFSMGRATIDSEATSYRFASDITLQGVAVSKPNYASCEETAWRVALATELPAGETIGGITATVTQGPGGGPANVIGSVAETLIIMKSGVGVPIYVRGVFAVGPLVVALVNYTGVEQPVPADLQAKLLNLVATRAARG